MPLSQKEENTKLISKLASYCYELNNVLDIEVIFQITTKHIAIEFNFVHILLTEEHNFFVPEWMGLLIEELGEESNTFNNQKLKMAISCLESIMDLGVCNNDIKQIMINIENSGVKNSHHQFT